MNQFKNRIDLIKLSKLKIIELDEASKKKESDDEADYEENATIFVKNLNFDTEEDSLLSMFSKIGKCKVNVARKLSPKGESLSMGYGFVKFKKVSVNNN